MKYVQVLKRFEWLENVAVFFKNNEIFSSEFCGNIHGFLTRSVS